MTKATASRLAAVSTLIQAPPVRLTQVTEHAARLLSLELPGGTGTSGTNEEEHDSIKTLTRSVDQGEKCPACRSQILFSHLSLAVCAKGHSWGACSVLCWVVCESVLLLMRSFYLDRFCWPVRTTADSVGCWGHLFTERCSVTYAVIDTPEERTCIGCCRRSLVPKNKEGEEDWVSEALLMASHFCGLCGNRYARMV